MKCQFFCSATETFYVAVHCSANYINSAIGKHPKQYLQCRVVAKNKFPSEAIIYLPRVHLRILIIA